MNLLRLVSSIRNPFLQVPLFQVAISKTTRVWPNKTPWTAASFVHFMRTQPATSEVVILFTQIPSPPVIIAYSYQTTIPKRFSWISVHKSIYQRQCRPQQSCVITINGQPQRTRRPHTNIVHPITPFVQGRVTWTQRHRQSALQFHNLEGNESWKKL